MLPSDRLREHGAMLDHRVPDRWRCPTKLNKMGFLALSTLGEPHCSFQRRAALGA